MVVNRKGRAFDEEDGVAYNEKASKRKRKSNAQHDSPRKRAADTVKKPGILQSTNKNVKAKPHSDDLVQTDIGPNLSHTSQLDSDATHATFVKLFKTFKQSNELPENPDHLQILVRRLATNWEKEKSYADDIENDNEKLESYLAKGKQEVEELKAELEQKKAKISGSQKKLVKSEMEGQRLQAEMKHVETNNVKLKAFLRERRLKAAVMASRLTSEYYGKEAAIIHHSHIGDPNGDETDAPNLKQHLEAEMYDDDKDDKVQDLDHKEEHGEQESGEQERGKQQNTEPIVAEGGTMNQHNDADDSDSYDDDARSGSDGHTSDSSAASTASVERISKARKAKDVKKGKN